jgi:aminoglycoside 2'-N-acetyltransferase I
VTRVELFDENDVPAAWRAQTDRLRESAWPSPTGDRSGSRHDRALSPQTLLLLDGVDVVAALDVLTKDITHAGAVFRARGISAMVTDPDRRRQRLGHRLAAAAHDVIANGGVDLGIFTCDRPLAPFYEGAGWPVLPGAVLIGGTVDDPFPGDQPGFDKVTLADFFSPASVAARGAFVGARIELYPGVIDRLW